MTALWLVLLAQQSAFPGQYAPSPADWKYPVWPVGCTRFEGTERVACLEFNVADYGKRQRFVAANAALPAPRTGERRVVFFGDSITDNWSKPGYGDFFPGKPYVNRGIGGQTTAQMLLRFRPDVIKLQPAAVVILAGTNDLAGNAGTVPMTEILDNLMSMAELAKQNGIKVVLATVLPVSDDKKNPQGEPLVRTGARAPNLIQALNGLMRNYAAAQGHEVLDYYSAMADAKDRLKPELNDDGLHPNAAGYAVMAPLAEAAITRALVRK